MNEERITQEEVEALEMMMLMESYATASDIRGKTPFELDNKASDLSKVEISYSVQYDSYEIKVFYQQQTKTKGRTFELRGINPELLGYISKYISHLREKRANKTLSSVSVLDKFKKSISNKIEDDKEIQRQLDLLNK